MTIDKNTNFLIVGLGLLGGSYAKALKKAGYKVSAITKDKETVAYALENNIVDYATIDVDPLLIENADLVVFALYPKIFIDWISQYGSLLKKGTIITDVTGVKSGIIDTVQKLLPDGVEFISAHPMAGREQSGIEFSDDSVFKNANYLVVPTDKNTKNAIDVCINLGNILGFKDISVLSADEHDKNIAFLSQLTHCIAVSLMCCCDDPMFKFYSGDSFRDLTRIAKINEEMWSELFLLNRDFLLSEMQAFEDSFAKLKKTIENNDAATMKEMMRLSSKRRSQFDKRE